MNSNGRHSYPNQEPSTTDDNEFDRFLRDRYERDIFPEEETNPKEEEQKDDRK